MALLKTPYGDFLGPPCTDEENEKIEQRLRGDGDITVVFGPKATTDGKKAKPRKPN